jgi:nitrite reductase (NADH) small subunit
MECDVATWQRLAAVTDVPAGTGGEYIAGDRIVALFNVDGKFYALDGICPHQGGPLGKGFLDGCIVTCPWHGFQFDVTTGQHLTSRSLVHPVFPVKVEDGGVWVNL